MEYSLSGLRHDQGSGLGTDRAVCGGLEAAAAGVWLDCGGSRLLYTAISDRQFPKPFRHGKESKEVAGNFAASAHMGTFVVPVETAVWLSGQRDGSG